MPTYVLLLRNDSVGASQMLFNLVSGAEAYRGAVERFDGVLETLYPVMGRYDVVAVVRFPSDAACAAFTLASTAQGQYAEQLRVLDSEDLSEAERLHEQALRRAAEDEAAARSEYAEPAG